MWSGKVWEAVNPIKLQKAVESLLDEITAACRGLLATADPETINGDPLARKTLAMANYMVKCSNDVPITHILKLARDMMSIEAKELDSHPHLLACANGTINLRTGVLAGERYEVEVSGGQPGQSSWAGEWRRSDLITKLIDIDYLPGARHGRLEQFLNSAFEGNTSVIGFIQRWGGYNLTGDISAEKFAIIKGKGGCGKSLIIDMLHVACGAHSTICPFAIWTKSRYDNDGEAASPFLSNLEGARCITCSEVEEGKILRSAGIKSFTGGDTVTARKLHQAPRRFKPVGKLTFFCNDLPKVDILDSGFWRRALVVDMPYVPDDATRDETLKAVIRDDRSAKEFILAFFVEGAVKWYAEGLNPPVEVANVTAMYKEEQNPLGTFLDEAMDPEVISIKDYRPLLRSTEETGGDLSMVPASPLSDIMAVVNQMRQDDGEMPIKKRTLAMLLKGLGFEDIRRTINGRQQRCYAGILIDMAAFPGWLTK